MRDTCEDGRVKRVESLKGKGEQRERKGIGKEKTLKNGERGGRKERKKESERLTRRRAECQYQLG